MSLLTRTSSICILFFLLAASCLSKDPRSSLQLPSGEVFAIRVADTPQKRIKGLSGVKKEEFGMLFLYPSDRKRSFWMPDTWFDLDIFFLDENLTVTALERSLPRHPGRTTPPPIARTGSHLCRHVLELRSDNPLSAKIILKTRLKALFDHPLLQKAPEIHRAQ